MVTCASCFFIAVLHHAPGARKSGQGDAGAPRRGGGAACVHSSALPVGCSLPPSSPHPAFLRSDEPKGPPWPPLGPLPSGTTVKPPRGLRSLLSCLLPRGRQRRGYSPGSGGRRTWVQVAARQHHGWGRQDCDRTIPSLLPSSTK